VAWKKPEENPSHPEPPAPPRPLANVAPPLEPRRLDRAIATIGPSIFIKGDLSGDEDLVIEGRVEGKIDLKQHNVTIGKNGRVNADVFGNTVIIEGEVDGNLFAQQQAVLRQSGAVRGNITAPRVILEDGSRFRGSIDMDDRGAAKPGPDAAKPGPDAAKPGAGAAPAVAPGPAASPANTGGGAAAASEASSAARVASAP
jgi:cytoskeletal protein CcmA (bactofilin family)